MWCTRAFGQLCLSSLLVSLLSGCFSLPFCRIDTACNLNSFQATIRSIPDMADDATSTKQSVRKRAVLLIHGIYGDEDAFGKLQTYIEQDFPGTAVFRLHYWSSATWPNFQRLDDLGSVLAEHIEKLSDYQEIDIIAHSMGGLISRDALIKLKTKGARENPKLLEMIGRTHLVMIGTPNRGSLYALLNNIFVNSVFAPLTLVSYPLTGRPFVYNRQAYDMARSSFPLFPVNTRYINDLNIRWFEAFGLPGTPVSPSVYAIVGAKDLMAAFTLSDGVVEARNVLFAGVPDSHVFYVPYKHFDEEVKISGLEHRTYETIRQIISCNESRGIDCPSSSVVQKISPMAPLSLAYVLFARKAVQTDDDVRQISVRVKDEEPVFRPPSPDEQSSHNPIVGMVESTAWSAVLLASYPFTITQAVLAVPIGREQVNYETPTYSLIGKPKLLLDGSYDGNIVVHYKDVDLTLYADFSLIDRPVNAGEHMIVKQATGEESSHRFVREEVPADSHGYWGGCEAVLDLHSLLEDPPTKMPLLKVSANHVNIVEVEPIGSYKVKLSVVGCKEEALFAHYLRSHEYDRAIEEAGIAIAAYPKYAFPLLVRSAAKWEKKDVSGALEDITRAIQIAPRYARAYIQRGEIHLAMHNEALARTDFDRALKLSDNKLEMLVKKVWEDRRFSRLPGIASGAMTTTPVEGNATVGRDGPPGEEKRPTQ